MLQGLLNKFKPQYLGVVLATTGLAAGIYNANHPTANAAYGAGGATSKGSMAIVQEALDLEADLTPNPDNKYGQVKYGQLNIYANGASNGPLGPPLVQCAQFVYTVYDKAGYTLPTGGNAIDYWDYYSNDPNYRFVPGKVGTAKPNYHPDQWQEIPVKSALPTPGDIIVWGGGSNEDGYTLGGDPAHFNGTDGIGHVAIVVAVQTPQGNTDGSITVAEANGPGNLTVNNAGATQSLDTSPYNIQPVTFSPGISVSSQTYLYQLAVKPDLSVETWSDMYILGYVHNTTKDFQTSAGPTISPGPWNLPMPPLPQDATIQHYVSLAEQDATADGIDPMLYVRQIWQESGFSASAVSPAGAIGIAQFMPDTAAGYGFDPHDPVKSLYYGALYDENNLKELKNYPGLSKAYSDKDFQVMMIAAYNTGAGNVENALRIVENALNQAGNQTPWYLYLADETKTYIDRIFHYYFFANYPAYSPPDKSIG